MPTNNSDARERAREWRCFHCDEVFTDAQCARLHFGIDESHTPACLIAGAEGGLLKALRDAEEQADEAIQRMHDESTDAAKAYHRQRTRHTQSLIAAEEAGYEKGLRDGRELAFAAAPRSEGDWVTVPREPTEAMVEAGIDAMLMSEGDLFDSDTYIYTWRAMLAAAPTPHPACASAVDGHRCGSCGKPLTVDSPPCDCRGPVPGFATLTPDAGHGVLEEREACAKVAGDQAAWERGQAATPGIGKKTTANHLSAAHACEIVEAAIRARCPESPDGQEGGRGSA